MKYRSLFPKQIPKSRRLLKRRTPRFAETGTRKGNRRRSKKQTGSMELNEIMNTGPKGGNHPERRGSSGAIILSGNG